MACMDSSSHHHHHQQEMMASQSLDNILICTKPQNQGQQQEKKPRPTEEAPKCPRCDSTNTKFCYYNNYSLSQPRYFCKSCRRYWTKGGTLRNVPVGGGCRKNRRSSSLSRRTSPDHDQPHHHVITSIPTSSISTSPSPSPSSSSLASPNSILFSPFDHQYHTLSTNDLTLGMARLHKQVDGSMGFDHHENHGNISLLGNPSGNSHFDLFGNSFLIDQPNNGLHQLYYRLGGNNVNVSTNEDNNQQNRMGMQYDQHSNDQEMMSNPSSSSSTPSTIKQEVGENKVLWGLPWKLTSGEDNNMNGSGGDNELASIKETWNNGVIGSSWFNLLNSPII